MRSKIVVVTHKDYDMPSDEIYLPLCVGENITALSRKYQPDNVGDNISYLNKTYCELTAIYWAWKNLDLKKLDYIGLAHYRRHFTVRKKAKEISDVITNEELWDQIEQNPVNAVFTTPKRYYMESVEDHYIHSLRGYENIHKADIQRLRNAIQRYAPEYRESAEKVLRGNSAHMLNMFIMNGRQFDDYCAWLFPILDSVVEQSLDREDQRRYAGALSEFCLDIWLIKNKFYIKELNLLELEKESLGKKITSYVKRRVGIKWKKYQ